MIQGVVLFAAFVLIIAKLLIEIAYAAPDPRVGTAEGATASYALRIRCADRTGPPHGDKTAGQHGCPTWMGCAGVDNASSRRARLRLTGR
jgi:hypothetical protein